MGPLLNIAVKAARQAGDIIMRAYENFDEFEVTEKTQNDYVTNIDVRAEEAIIQTIHKAYPEHNILAEESGQTTKNSQAPTWIIDPLDGTRNFMHGFPHFAVSIGITDNNKLEHGVIFDPIRNDLFTTSRGKGAYLNNRRMRVSPRSNFHKALIGTEFPLHEQMEKYLPTLQIMIKEAGGIRRAGAAAIDLAYVAAGRLDGFWQMGLKPWDMAAGALLIKEAGGLVSDFYGAENYLSSGNIIAGNPKMFKMLLQKIQPFVKLNPEDYR